MDAYAEILSSSAMGGQPEEFPCPDRLTPPTPQLELHVQPEGLV